MPLRLIPNAFCKPYFPQNLVHLTSNWPPTLKNSADYQLAQACFVILPVQGLKGTFYLRVQKTNRQLTLPCLFSIA